MKHNKDKHTTSQCGKHKNKTTPVPSCSAIPAAASSHGHCGYESPADIQLPTPTISEPVKT